MKICKYSVLKNMILGFYLKLKKLFGLLMLKKMGTFFLYYQPQFDLENRKLSTIEVLLRYRGKNGEVSAPFFIEDFNDLGLTPILDFWVLEKALKETEILAEFKGFSLSINISPMTFEQHDFIPRVIRCIDKSKFEFSQIEFELTEDVSVNNKEDMSFVFEQLKALGISLALDDFGTGYTSIYEMAQYRFDKIKIDRSLIAGINNANGKKYLNK